MGRLPEPTQEEYDRACVVLKQCGWGAKTQSTILLWARRSGLSPKRVLVLASLQWPLVGRITACAEGGADCVLIAKDAQLLLSMMAVIGLETPPKEQ